MITIFSDFRQFGEKMAFFSKTNVMINRKLAKIAKKCDHNIGPRFKVSYPRACVEIWFASSSPRWGCPRECSSGWRPWSSSSSSPSLGQQNMCIRNRIQKPGANPATFVFTGAFLHRRKIIFILKTRQAIGCVENFYNAGVVSRDRRIGSCCNFAPVPIQCDPKCLQS
jgi:hypothetical protein